MTLIYFRFLERNGHTMTTQTLRQSREPIKVVRCSFQYGIAIHRWIIRGRGKETLAGKPTI